MYYPICWHGLSIDVQGVIVQQIPHLCEESFVLIALNNLMKRFARHNGLASSLLCLFGGPFHHHSKIVLCYLSKGFSTSMVGNGRPLMP